MRCLPYSAALRRSNDNAKTTPHPSKWSRMDSIDLHSTRSIKACKELSTRPKSCCSWPRRHEEATRRPNNPRGKKADQDELMISPSLSLFWFKKACTGVSTTRDAHIAVKKAIWCPVRHENQAREAPVPPPRGSLLPRLQNRPRVSNIFTYLWLLYRDMYISQLNSFSSLIELSWSVGALTNSTQKLENGSYYSTDIRNKNQEQNILKYHHRFIR